MSTVTHPPCGLYRTTQALEGIPAGRLVYFHNHGDPGAGIYLPSGWSLNRARWHERGATVPGPEWSATLTPLPPEGLYRVRATFFCCSQKCREFPTDAMVQLGYDGEGTAILFVPEWTPQGLGFPERGARLDADQLQHLALLHVAASSQAPAGPAHLLH